MKAGIGLRAPHVQTFLDQDIDVGFLEVHSENYFGGGRNPKQLKSLSERYDISLHGVGLSLGDQSGLDIDHLNQLKKLVQEIKPIFVSEHLSWSSYQHRYTPDLLPIAFTNQSLKTFIQHINKVQEHIDSKILIENPSNYLAFKDLEYSEPEFLNILSQETGCGILLDINNIAVSAHNLGYDAHQYIDTIKTIDEIHLAGYQINTTENGDTVYLDTHGKPVYDEVWALYDYALNKFGATPTLIEWDTDIPALNVLLHEAEKADYYLNQYSHAA